MLPFEVVDGTLEQIILEQVTEEASKKVSKEKI